LTSGTPIKKISLITVKEKINFVKKQVKIDMINKISVRWAYQLFDRITGLTGFDF
jgi:hypothetical protein